MQSLFNELINIAVDYNVCRTKSTSIINIGAFSNYMCHGIGTNALLLLRYTVERGYPIIYW